MRKLTVISACSKKKKRKKNKTHTLKTILKNTIMTRYAKRRTKDRLHCTYSAIIDIFEMENNREPTAQEVNKIILTLGDRGAIAR